MRQYCPSYRLAPVICTGVYYLATPIAKLSPSTCYLPILDILPRLDCSTKYYKNPDRPNIPRILFTKSCSYS